MPLRLIGRCRAPVSKGELGSCVVLAIAAILAGGSAQAATCPDFPSPAIRFIAMPGDIEHDAGKTARELGGAAKPMPVRYERALASSTAQSMTLETMPDGTVCAALKDVEFKIGFKRKMYVAQEFSGEPCVADTVIDSAMPLVRSDDIVLAQFGASIGQSFAGDFKAIATASGKNKEEAQKPIADKIQGLWQSKILPAFMRELADSAGRVDAGQWRKASCGGATDKAFAAIGGSSTALLTPMQMPRAPVSGMMDAGGRDMMGSGAGGR